MYRGKSLANDQWCYGGYVENIIAFTGEHQLNGHITADNKTSFDCIVTEEGIIVPVKRDTVSEFTGRLDKNNKKIFDGDVVDDSWGRKMVVFFDEEKMCWRFNAMTKTNFKAADMWQWFSRSIQEVIITGNIYEVM